MFPGGFPFPPGFIPQGVHQQQQQALEIKSEVKSFLYLGHTKKTAEYFDTLGTWYVSLKNNTIPIPTQYVIGVYSDPEYFYYRLWAVTDLKMAETIQSKIKEDPDFLGLRSELLFSKKKNVLETVTDSLFNDAEFFALLQVFFITPAAAMTTKGFKIDMKNRVISNLKEVFETHWKLPKSKNNDFYVVENKNEFFSVFQKIPNCILFYKSI